MKLSIVIPVYNQEKLICRAIESCPKRDDVEVIVVNDGCTDNTVTNIFENLDKFTRNFRCISLMENQGVANALNAGLKDAKGEYYIALGSDDYFYTDVLNKFIDEDLDGTDMVYFCLRRNDGSLIEPNEKTRALWVGSTKAYKKSIIDMAKKNAREHLEKFITRDKQKYNKTYGALEKLQKELNLSRPPKRIECYDISNTSGVLSVASMVVFENGEPKRSHYRKFKIRSVEGPNDFASLKEALTRRLSELDKGENESFKNKPDLIVIDGGKGQLSSTYEVIKPYNIDTISLAKQFEEVYLPNDSTPKMLKRGSAELQILQNIRDEAHRFAITFHKNLRNKNTFKSPLDDIKGLGKVKKANLIKTFKTSDEVAKASIEELNLVKGIDLNLATRIYNHFHEK